MRDLCPKLIRLRIDQPQAAPIGACKISSEVRIEPHKLFDLLLLANAGCVFKYRACNAIRAGVLGCCRVHKSTLSARRRWSQHISQTGCIQIAGSIGWAKRNSPRCLLESEYAGSRQ